MLYDVAIIGLGIYGTSCADAAASVFQNVVGFDANGLASPAGSSQGDTRLFRRTTFENPSYFDLASDADVIWQELDHATGGALIQHQGYRFIADGILAAAADQHGVADPIDAIEVIAREHSIETHRLTGLECQDLIPFIDLSGTARGIEDVDAYTLHPEGCVRALAERATARGASLHPHTAVVSAYRTGDLWTLEIDGGPHVRARRLIDASGKWELELPGRPSAPRPKLFPQTVVWAEPSGSSITAPTVVSLADRTLLYMFPPSPRTNHVKYSIENTLHEVALGDGHGTKRRRNHLEREYVAAIRRIARIPKTAAVRVSSCDYVVMPEFELRASFVPIVSLVTIRACSGHGFKYAPGIAARVVRALSEQGPASDEPIELV